SALQAPSARLAWLLSGLTQLQRQSTIAGLCISQGHRQMSNPVLLHCGWCVSCLQRLLAVGLTYAQQLILWLVGLRFSDLDRDRGVSNGPGWATGMMEAMHHHGCIAKWCSVDTPTPARSRSPLTPCTWSRMGGNPSLMLLRGIVLVQLGVVIRILDEKPDVSLCMILDRLSVGGQGSVIGEDSGADGAGLAGGASWRAIEASLDAVETGALESACCHWVLDASSNQQRKICKTVYLLMRLLVREHPSNVANKNARCIRFKAGYSCLQSTNATVVAYQPPIRTDPLRVC
ncbi:uncharacterized protein BCR38DRAFT_495944, partial [Pseudomassariella vexata]